MSWENILGWSDDIVPWHVELAKTLPQGARFVEVGVLLGRSIAHIGTIRPDLDLWAIDSWEGKTWGEPMTEIVERHGGVWPAFLACMREHAPDVLDRLHVVRARSTDVDLGRADVVFIDADHSYESVRDDIEHWGEQVVDGGILAGHDRQGDYPGVVRAVNEAFADSEIHTGPGDWSSVWWVRV